MKIILTREELIGIIKEHIETTQLYSIVGKDPRISFMNSTLSQTETDVEHVCPITYLEIEKTQ